ncbi:MAG: ABC transporter ATP-binding protein [Tepidisphaeraceae bacterium]
MSAIELEHVRKTFGDFVAVNDLSLSVPQNTLCGFIGPNGSGKTTTLRMIMRIYAPDRGRVRVLGEDHHGPANDRVGYLPEERMLYKAMRVDEVLTYLSRLKGHRPTVSEINHWLDLLQLQGFAKRRVQTLSKGQTQKIQLIAVLIARPQLVLLDEPFSGLDPVNADVMRDAILQLKENGATVLFSTHDMAVAEKMCDRVIMIDRGNKVLDGTLDEIRTGYGMDTVRVRVAGTPLEWGSLPGVESVTPFGQYQELRLSPGANPQAILDDIHRRAAVELFEITRPSLHDIFVRIARKDLA